jgi:hypothetical protein
VQARNRLSLGTVRVRASQLRLEPAALAMLLQSYRDAAEVLIDQALRAGRWPTDKSLQAELKVDPWTHPAQSGIHALPVARPDLRTTFPYAGVVPRRSRRWDGRSRSLMRGML